MTTILILAILGIILVMAEMVLPGGVIGIFGVGCMIAAVVLTFINYGVNAGAFASIALLVFGMAAFIWWMKNFKRLPFTRSLVLGDTIDDQERSEKHAALLGKDGITTTKIAPSGQVMIDGEKLDVLSELGVIEKGERVEIIDVRGPSIFVQKA